MSHQIESIFPPNKHFEPADVSRLVLSALRVQSPSDAESIGTTIAAQHNIDFRTNDIEMVASALEDRAMLQRTELGFQLAPIFQD
jgi:hypothetical protein